MAQDDKDWLVELSHPFLPLGLRITRMSSTEEVNDVLVIVKERLPEWRATTIDLNRVMRDLDKASKHDTDLTRRNDEPGSRQ